MIAFDAGQLEIAEAHARAAGGLYDRLADPWGQVEIKVISAQIALECGRLELARAELAECERIPLLEAEPKQHLALTRAWLAYYDGKFQDAAQEIFRAREAFQDRSGAGDHTPELLRKFARMAWPAPAGLLVDAWLEAHGKTATPPG